MTAVPYPSDGVISFIPRRRRRARVVIAALFALAVVLVLLDYRATGAARLHGPTPTPTSVAHVAAKPRPAAPRLSASIAGHTYACTVVPPKPAKH